MWVSLGSSCLGLSVLPEHGDLFLLQVREFFSHNFVKYIFDCLFSLSSFWDACDENVSILDVDPKVS